MKKRHLILFTFLCSNFIFGQSENKMTLENTLNSAPLAWPKTGMGLDGINYYSTYPPFTDVVKSMRWIDAASWNTNGYPASASAGKTVRGRCGVSNAKTWPQGRYVLTWTGNGNVKLIRDKVTLVSENLSGNVKRRVYDVSHPSGYGVEIEITSYPVDNIHIYLPDMENHNSLWNPAYIDYMEPFRGSVLRFMDMNGTNSSVQKNWNDRAPRNWSTYVNNNSNSAEHQVKGKVSYEAMIELCNELDADMWVCIPHLATDDYVTKLATLIKTGKDGNNQVTQSLEAGRKVWLEYSNEVWNWNFEQSTWVDQNLPGAGLDERYARHAVHLFDVFRTAFNDNSRVVRVLGTQVGYGGGFRTKNRINAVDRSKFDAIALTTYFNPGFQQWLYNNWGVSQKPALDYLDQKVGSGVFVEKDPNGNDEVENAYWTYYYGKQYNVPVIAYEGNDHLNPTGKIDTNGDGKGDASLSDVYPEAVDFIHTMVRTPRFGEIYKKWIDRHHKSGLLTNMPFVLLAGWAKYGQWGHVEYMCQPVEEAIKYKALLDYYKLSYPRICGTVSTGIKKADLEEIINVYPNPATDEVNIDLKNWNDEVLVEIRNSLGQGIRSIQYTVGSGRVMLNTSGLPQGIYYISVSADGLERQSNKVIIAR